MLTFVIASSQVQLKSESDSDFKLELDSNGQYDQEQIRRVLMQKHSGPKRWEILGDCTLNKYFLKNYKIGRWDKCQCKTAHAPGRLRFHQNHLTTPMTYPVQLAAVTLSKGAKDRKWLDSSSSTTQSRSRRGGTSRASSTMSNSCQHSILDGPWGCTMILMTVTQSKRLQWKFSS